MEMVVAQLVLRPVFAGVFLACFLIFYAISKEPMGPSEDGKVGII